jgi:hypothetical protein
MTRWLAPIGLLLALLTAACANNGEVSDSDKQNGFYGSITGGGARP